MVDGVGGSNVQFSVSDSLAPPALHKATGFLVVADRENNATRLVDSARALLIAKSVLAVAYHHRDEGITWGGLLHSTPRLQGSIFADGFDLADGAPSQLEGHADAATGAVPLMGILLSLYGAVVVAMTKKINAVVTSSHQGEQLATSRGVEIIQYARIIARAFGIPVDEPNFLGTDNKANLLVATHSGSSARSRHFLVRYEAVKEAMKSGEVQLGHVRDEHNPADF